MSEILINVHLKSEILDPQGRALLGAMERQNVVGLRDVRQGKQFLLKFEGPLDSEQFLSIQKLACELLSNPVIEEYSIEVKNES